VLGLDWPNRAPRTWMDVACGNGSHIVSVVNDYGYNGQIIGLNYPQSTYTPGEDWAKKNGYSNIHFKELDARDLETDHFSGISDNSVDKLTFSFAGYHMEDIDKVLRGFQRIVRPGGQLAIATRGNFNQIRLWEKIASLHGLVAPPSREYRYEIPAPPEESYYEKFDLEDAEAVLAQFFKVDYVRKHESILKFPTPSDALTRGQRLKDYDKSEAWADYMLALESLKDSFQPKAQGGDLIRAIYRYIAPQVAIEIEANREKYGEPFFTDYWQEGFIVCINEKDGYTVDPSEETLYRVTRPDIAHYFELLA
jgi:ubiquinone/menaquinone biosynthesis C-methylase UbiE